MQFSGGSLPDRRPSSRSGGPTKASAVITSGSASDDDGASEGNPGQYLQRGGGNPDAAVADRMAEYGRVRPAVKGDRAGAAAEGVQGVRVHTERQDQRAAGWVRWCHRGKQKRPPGGGGRVRGALGHRP